MTESSDRKGDWESVFLCLGDKTTVRTTALSLARQLSQSTRLVVCAVSVSVWGTIFRGTAFTSSRSIADYRQGVEFTLFRVGEFNNVIIRCLTNLDSFKRIGLIKCCQFD